MIPRLLTQRIQAFKGRKRALVVLGPRRVGKTTLMASLFDPRFPGIRWYNGEEPGTQDLFKNPSAQKLKTLIGNAKTVVLDEAQRIESIGLVVKLLVDSNPEIQFIITGSSALELAAGISESMTGRKYDLNLYPLSFGEMAAHIGLLEEIRMIEHRLTYGYYPDIVAQPGLEQVHLNELYGSYLYKDLLAYQQIKKPAVLEKLVKALALQLGNEVSFNEISQLVGLDKEAVERYIDLLEKAFVVFRLPALSRNMRNEIKRGRKIYFYDVGIRNAAINTYNPPGLRNDTGALWENYCIVERMKALEYAGKKVGRYFWRTTTQHEVDYIEEYDGKLYAYEFKWNPKAKVKTQKAFLEAYPGTEIKVITPKNIEEFALIQEEKK